MIFDTFKHMCIVSVGMIEAERETNLDFTNINGVQFEVVTMEDKKGFYFGVIMQYGNSTNTEIFLTVTEPEKTRAMDVINATIAMADFIEEKKNIDQYDLQELNKRHFEDN